LDEQEQVSMSLATATEMHGSIQEAARKSQEGLSLQDCLDAYTHEECLNEVRSQPGPLY
jgi:hypothetical protein